METTTADFGPGRDSGTSAVPGGLGAAKVIADAAAKTLSAGAAGGAIRPVGRPRKDGLPSGSRPPEAAKSPGVKADPEPIPAGLVQNAVDSGLQEIDRFLQRKTYHTAFDVTKEEAIARRLAGDVALHKDQREQMALLSETCAQQYGLAGQHTPAILLAVCMAAYAAKVAMTLNTLAQISEANKIPGGSGKKAAAEVATPDDARPVSG